MSRKPNKGLSKYKKGFPVKLSLSHIAMLHITYVWLHKHGQTTPDLDDLMPTLPPFVPIHGLGWRQVYGSKTVRVRAPEVGPLITLMAKASELPFTSCGVFRSRTADLKKLSELDLMVDAQRE